MNLDFMVVADVVSARPDGKLDLHGVGWDTIYAAAVPATHPRTDVAMRFLLSAQEVEAAHQVVMTVMGADGPLGRVEANTPPMPEEQRAAIPAGHRIGVGIVLNLAGLTFPAYGSYSIVVTWDGTEVREPIRLFVEPLPAQLQG